MKFPLPITIAAFAICALAAPAELEERQFGFSTSTRTTATTSSKAVVATTSSKAAVVTTSSSSKAVVATTSTKTSTAAASSGTNDVVDNTGCKKVTLIFARGTGESATLGYVVGPGLASNLRTAAGDAAVQGVDYPADAAGDADQGGSGGPTMAGLAVQALKQCPNTKIILAGYSQGALVLHNATSNSTTSGKVSAVAAFGDPLNGQGFSNVATANIVRYCGSQDSICDGSGVTNTTGSHTSYGDNVKEAAYHLASIVGVLV